MTDRRKIILASKGAFLAIVFMLILWLEKQGIPLRDAPAAVILVIYTFFGFIVFSLFCWALATALDDESVSNWKPWACYVAIIGITLALTAARSQKHFLIRFVQYFLCFLISLAFIASGILVGYLAGRKTHGAYLGATVSLRREKRARQLGWTVGVFICIVVTVLTLLLASSISWFNEGVQRLHETMPD